MLVLEDDSSDRSYPQSTTSQPSVHCSIPELVLPCRMSTRKQIGRNIMRHYMGAVLIVGIWTMIRASAQASAQQVSSFEQLQVLVKPGDTIVVIGTDGTTSKGEIQSLTPASLRLVTKGNIKEFSQR